MHFPVDGQTGYAAGRNGVLLKTTDGGSWISEPAGPEPMPRGPLATLARGVLWVSLQPTANGSQPALGLHDATSRKVMALRPGQNDVSRLSPGVYFVRESSAASSQHSGASSVGKVVIAR